MSFLLFCKRITPAPPISEIDVTDGSALPVECIAGPPVGQLLLIGDVFAQQKTELRRLPQRGEIPIAWNSSDGWW